MPVAHTSERFTVADGVHLACQAWRPARDTRAVLAVVHGYGEHGGRYRELAVRLTEHGLAVHVCDLRGHGRSSGRRGYVSRFSDYLDDTAVHLDIVRREDPGLPVFVLGHSLGGLIASSFVEQRRGQDLSGLVLSAPFLRLAIPVSPLKVLAARAASVVAPTMDVGNPLDPARLSHDQAVVSACRTDPLNHNAAPARWAAEILNAQRATLAAAGRISLPLLVMYGDADPVADPAGARELCAAASSRDKTERSYSGFYHEIFNETGREAPIADLLAWLDGHVPAG